MLRTIFGLAAGLVAGIVVVGLVESAGHMIFPPPPGANVSDPETLRAIMGDVPLGAKIAVLVAWAAGVFAGGGLAAFIARRAWPAWAIGALLMAAGAWTMMLIPHPLWMWAGALAATGGAAYAAGRLFGKRNA